MTISIGHRDGDVRLVRYRRVIDWRAAATISSELHADLSMKTSIVAPITQAALIGALWARKAGGLASFERYSDAPKASGVIWDDRSLDGWLTDPQRIVPDNAMPFDGIKHTAVRADLLAFLKRATKPGAQPQRRAEMGDMGRMGGMMGGGMGDDGRRAT